MDPQHTLAATRSTAGALPGRVRRSAPQPAPRTVVIVGAGFCGSAVATHLLRLPHPQPLRVVLIERAQLARGLAYARRRQPYLLNVPAGRMSASCSDPLEFLSYARRTLPHAGGADFLPRELYGQYLESRLLSAERDAAPHVRLERVHAEVMAVERVHRSAGLRVWLDAGVTIAAHSVVLALGNPPPAPLPGSEALREERYLADPWQADAELRPGETVLVAGTGLTMADVVLCGQESAGGLATVHAISRHGLLPLPQEERHGTHDEWPCLSALRSSAVCLRGLTRELRELSEDLERRGGDWRAAITAVRAAAPTLWQRLTLADRARFLRHLRAYWDVHRHRLPPGSCSALAQLRDQGRLHVHAGRILALESAGKKVRVTWRARGARSSSSLLVDRVLNCTGPHYDARHTRERLLRSLIAQGIASTDPLGLGIATDESGALVDASGRSSANLYYVGPMLRGAYWETTAVQELRVYAERLACHLARGWHAAGGTRARLGMSA